MVIGAEINGMKEARKEGEKERKKKKKKRALNPEIAIHKRTWYETHLL